MSSLHDEHTGVAAAAAKGNAAAALPAVQSGPDDATTDVRPQGGKTPAFSPTWLRPHPSSPPSCTTAARCSKRAQQYMAAKRSIHLCQRLPVASLEERDMMAPYRSLHHPNPHFLTTTFSLRPGRVCCRMEPNRQRFSGSWSAWVSLHHIHRHHMHALVGQPGVDGGLGASNFCLVDCGGTPRPRCP